MEIGGIAEALSGQKAGHLDPTRRILKLQLDDREVGVAWTGEAVAATHRGDDRRCFTRHKSLNPSQCRIVDIVPGVMRDQITHQQQTETGQTFGKFRADPFHLSQGGVQLRTG